MTARSSSDLAYCWRAMVMALGKYPSTSKGAQAYAAFKAAIDELLAEKK